MQRGSASSAGPFELIVEVHFSSWEMTVPRNLRDSTVTTALPSMVMGGSKGGAPTIPTLLLSSRVFGPHRLFNLLSVCRLVTVTVSDQAVPSANLWGVKTSGESTHLWGAPTLICCLKSTSSMDSSFLLWFNNSTDVEAPTIGRPPTGAILLIDKELP